MQWRSARAWRLGSSLLAAAFLAACEETDNLTGPRIANLSAVSGDTQTGPVGGLLPLPLVVRVVDQRGVGIADAEVTWTSSDGGPTATQEVDTTDADGYAQTAVRLGPTVGTQTVSAALNDVNPVVFTLNATTAPASRLVADSGDAQTGAVGEVLENSLVVLVTDAFGNPRPGVPVSFAVGAGGGAVSASSVISDAQGHSRVQWTLGTAAGTQLVTASTGSLPQLSFTATATPDDPARFVVLSGADQLAAPGATLPDSIVIRVVDQFGNAVGGVNVDWLPTAGSGTVAPSTTATNAAGRTATRWTLGNSGGPMTLRVRASGVDGTVPAAAFINFAKVTGGGRSSCAIDVGGVAYCWGFNGDGQLGIGQAAAGSGPIYAVPQAVPPTGSQTFLAINAGRYHNCAVTLSHVGYCWGDNNNGQVGIGSNTRTAVEPSLISVAVPFNAIAAGRAHSCGIAIGGRPYCWGDNERGQLGGNVTIDTVANTILLVPANEPKLVGSQTDGKFFGSFDVTAIAAGGVHTCAVTVAGTALCWGLGREGQRGDGSNSLSQYIPTAVNGGATYDSITAGFRHTCARTTTGAINCWGDNSNGQLGSGTAASSNVPVVVTGGLTFSQVTAGYGHTCALGTDGTAYCWGSNAQGQVGDGTTTSRTAPTPVGGGLVFRSLSAGDYHTCGVTTGGVAYCWGDNSFGAVGDGTQANRTSPSKVRFQQ